MSLFLKYAALFPLSISIILILVIAKYYFGKRRLFLSGSILPGPRPWPIIGNALEFRKKEDFLKKVTELNRRYGLARCWIGHQLYVFLCTPEDAKVYFRDLLDRPESMTYLESLIGRGMTVLNGSMWKKSRQPIEPALSTFSVQNLIGMIEEECDALLENLAKEEGKNPISLFPYINDCMFLIICNTICENAEEEDKALKNQNSKVFQYIFERMFSVWERFDFIYKHSKKGKDFYATLDDMKKKVDLRMDRKKDSSSEDTENSFGKRDFLRRLIRDNNWDNNLLTGNTIALLAAGFETTANHICFALIMLGIHKDVQEKLYNELMTASRNRSDKSDIYRVEYLKMVMNETLRLFPVVPLAFRKAHKDIQMGKHLIPEGAIVLFNMFAVQRDPKEFENPDAFNPDNFLPEKIEKRHPAAYLPFATGSRNCIGSRLAYMASKIAISKIVCKYKIECDLKMEDIELTYGIILKMKNGFCPLRLTAR